MPYQKAALSLDDVRNAMDHMLQEATKTSNRPLAIAICDDQGELVTFARMDRCAPQPPVVARKKAYTAARMWTDTKVYADRLKSQECSVTEFGDPNLLAAQGGVVITNPADQSVLEGIGVSGLTAEGDEALARIGLSAIVGR